MAHFIFLYLSLSQNDLEKSSREIMILQSEIRIRMSWKRYDLEVGNFDGFGLSFG
jgi:hypothetical protein